MEDYLLRNFKLVNGELWRLGERSGRWEPAPTHPSRSSPNGNTYLQVSTDRRVGRRHSFPIHRLIFLLHYGYLPKYVDHIDRNSLNNDPSNLRAASCSQNTANNTGNSGRLLPHGVERVKGSKFRARIGINGRNKHLGVYPTVAQASEAFRKAHVEIHGTFSPYYTEAV